VGWAMSTAADRATVIQALRMALARRQPPPGLIHHTDQGVQYTSPLYRAVLAHHGLVASMSRKGNCYDNAAVESFFSTLKNELIHDRQYHSREAALRIYWRLSIIGNAYIKVSGMSVPKSSRLVNVSPNWMSTKPGVAQMYFPGERSAPRVLGQKNKSVPKDGGHSW